MKTKISLVVFDLGNVMIRLASGWEDACVSAGVSYRSFVLTEDDRKVMHELGVLIETNAISSSDHALRICHLFRNLYTVDEISRIYQTIIQEEFPGIHDTVLALKTANYRTACLSNTCASHWTDLTNPARYPGIGALDYQHASHLLRAAKPDRRIYRLFEDATGFTPAQILFFDDRPENIQAALSCGWHAVQITAETPSVKQIHAALPRHGIEIDSAE